MIVKTFILKKKGTVTDSYKNYKIYAVFSLNDKRANKSFWKFIKEKGWSNYRVVATWKLNVFEYLSILIPFLRFVKDDNINKTKFSFTKEI